MNTTPVTQTLRRTTMTVAGLLALATACSASPASTPAEGLSPSADGTVSAEPTAPAYAGPELRLTVGTDDSPGVPSADQIEQFAERVASLSGGRITVKPKWHAAGSGHLDWDQEIARMVQAGKLDLAVGPTWAWDVLDVTSLQPLQSPFLVDSQELTVAVVQDQALSEALMSGLPEAGVHGLSLWPEGLRHPFGFDTVLDSPDDFGGQVIRSARSRAITMVFRALGARTSAEEPDATRMIGSQAEFALSPNGIGVANVTFFPKVNLLYGNADVLDGLDPAARDVLTAAAAETQAFALEELSELDAGRQFCADGKTVVHAAPEDLAALRRATRPAARAIAAPDGNAEVIAAIEELKSQTSDPEIAGTCTGTPPEKHEPGEAEAALNGTYRFTLTKQDYLDAGFTAQDAYNNAGVQTYVLEDGRVRYRLDPSERKAGEGGGSPDQAQGTYQVDGNLITFSFPAYDNEIDVVSHVVEPDGDLRLTLVSSNCCDEIVVTLTGKTWERIK